MLQLHDRLGDFEILRLLGKGGMGEVYEARQFNPDRRVALKVLAPWLSDDDDSLRRFWKEAEVPANLDHPSIVRIITTGKSSDGVAYYAMHLVRGISLAEMIRRGRPALMSEAVTRTLEGGNTPSAAADPAALNGNPAPEAGRLADAADGQEKPASTPTLGDEADTPTILQQYRQDRFTTLARIGAHAAQALAYAHSQGFLHRDIKPSNVMVDHHNHVYLVDFGLTRALESGGDSTQPGMIIGTPWYMSPEQAEGKPLDARSDIYSLGVTLYEMATQGVGPFAASRDNKQSVLAQVRAGETLPLRMLAPGIPEELERIIQRAIQLRPGKRHAAAADLARELEAFCGHESKPISMTAPTIRMQAPRAYWPVLVGAGLLAAALLVVAAMAVFRPRGEPNKPTPGALDGSQALPEVLRTAPPHIAVPILRVDNEPLWQKRVFGKGTYNPWPGLRKLDLISMDRAPATLFLLANPHRRDFDFAIEVDPVAPPEGAMVSNEGGIIFGWQRPENPVDGPRRCFAVQVDNRPQVGAPKGGATIGVFNVVPPGEGRANEIHLRPFPKAKSHVPFTSPPSHWRVIKVQVRDQRVVIDADGDVVEFTVEWLRQQKSLISDNLSFQGGVGIWSQHGTVGFRNATITYTDSAS